MLTHWSQTRHLIALEEQWGDTTNHFWKLYSNSVRSKNNIPNFILENPNIKIAYDEKCIYKNIYKKNSFRLGNKQVTKIHKFWNQNFATKNNFV